MSSLVLELKWSVQLHVLIHSVLSSTIAEKFQHSLSQLIDYTGKSKVRKITQDFISSADDIVTCCYESQHYRKYHGE